MHTDVHTDGAQRGGRRSTHTIRFEEGSVGSQQAAEPAPDGGSRVTRVLLRRHQNKGAAFVIVG